MASKVLVAYASTHGSTREVAEVVAETLAGHGLAVDLQPARDVRSLAGYHALVLGAPLYMFHLHKDALRFLSHNQRALGGMPIAVFAGGPFGEGNGKEWDEVRKNLDQELARFPWLKPVAVEVIGGKFDPATLRFPWNLIPALRNMPASDLRDWDAIRGWASLVAGQLQPALAQ